MYPSFDKKKENKDKKYCKFNITGDFQVETLLKKLFKFFIGNKLYLAV